MNNSRRGKSNAIVALLLFCLALGASAQPDTPKEHRTVGDVLSKYTVVVTEGDPDPTPQPAASEEKSLEEPAPKDAASEEKNLEEPASKEAAPAEEATVIDEATAILAGPQTPANEPVVQTQAEGDWKKQAQVGRSTFFDKMAEVTWALAFICLLIWALSKIVGRTTMEKLGLPVGSVSQIEILEKKRLTPGRSIMLVRVGPKVLALGATESGFQTLTEMDAEELKQHQDGVPPTEMTPEEAAANAEVPTSPADIAKHYLSIIPGLGEKK